MNTAQKSSSDLQDLNSILGKSRITHSNVSPSPASARNHASSVGVSDTTTSSIDARNKRSATVSSIDSLNIHSIERIKFNSSTAIHSMNNRSEASKSDKIANPFATKSATFQEDSNLPQNDTSDEDLHDGLQYNFKRIRSATTSTEIPIDPSPFQRNLSNNSDVSINPESPTWILSDLLSGLSAVKDKDEFSIVAKGNELVSLLQTYPDLKSDIILKNFINKIQFMLYHPVTEVRSLGYRLFRHIISSYESLVVLIQSKTLIFIIVTMSTTRSSVLEKEQALKLIREFLSIDKGADNLSIGVIKSLVSLIESGNEANAVDSQHLLQLQQQQLRQQEENNSKKDHHSHHQQNYQPLDASAQIVPETFKNLCIETICEIALLKPELIFHAGGFKVIVNTIIEGSIEMSLCCSLIIPKLLDFQNSRKFLRNGFDLISIISVFTDSYDDENSSTNNLQKTDAKKKQVSTSTFKLQKISFLITILLKNFNGLLAFSINDFQMLNDLISSLKKKNDKIREYVMDILYDILLIAPLPWLASSPIGAMVKKYAKGMKINEPVRYSYSKSLNGFEKKITSHFQGLVTLILIKKINVFGLLTNIIEERPANNRLVEKATHLLTSIYTMANNLLPAESISKDNLITPKVSSFIVEKVSRNKFQPSATYNKNLRINIKNMNIRARYNVEDLEFKTMIANTKVLTVKEFEDWNWGLLLNLIQGPFTNPKRFDELLEKNPKFLKRILSFYRPFKFRFCNISIHSKHSSKYINIGCQLLELFLKLDSGVKYLLNNKLLPQLSEIFAQIDPYSGIETKEPILAKKRLESTVSIGYLNFIGVLSSNNAGLRILERWQFFQIFNNIIDRSIDSSNYNLLITNLFKNVDLSIDSPFRIILLKSLKVSNLEMRTYFVTELLPDLIKTKELELYVVEILVHNLYDANREIVNSSISMLDGYFITNNFKNLSYFIDLNPSITILAKFKAGRNLLFNFLNIPQGFKYLEDSGFIDNEFNKWLGMSNDFTYLCKIEAMIHSCFFPYSTSKTLYLRREQEDEIENGSIVFFRNLLSTEEGLLYFNTSKQRNYVDRLINEIEVISNQLKSKEEFRDIDAQDESHLLLINTLKQNLWIIGIISSGKYGIQLLEPIYNVTSEKSIISIIIELCQTCSIWQIRGLCFYVIGMVSTTIEGIELLDESDWISVLDPYSNSKSLTYPKVDLSIIFNVSISNPYQDSKYHAIFGNKGPSANSNGASEGSDFTFPNATGSDMSKDVESSLINNNALLSSDAQHSHEFPSLPNHSFHHDDDPNTNDETYNKILFESIISSIHSMNSILNKIERRSYKELIRLKKSNPEVFSNLKLFLEIIKIIDRGNFKFHKRKFIFDMFLDSKVLEMLLKKERKYSIKIS